MLLFLFCFAAGLAAAQPTTPPPKPAPAKPATAPQTRVRRADVNLLGVVDANSGEARRNENIQFNLVDNNAVKEMNVRLGVTATLVQEFRPDRSYYTAEYGTRPRAPIHLGAAPVAGLHGNLWWTHSNSVFSARSFFQAGPVQPARENEWGISGSRPVWRGASLTVEGSHARNRGNVNGNVLVPRLDERTPLTTDPAKRALITLFMSGYPAQAPNRTDINERALNTNSLQSTDDHAASGTLDQRLGARDRLVARHTFTLQEVTAFQFVAGQNPDTTTRVHNARLSWLRDWSASTTSSASLNYDRVASLLAMPNNYNGPAVTVGEVLTRIGGKSSVPLDRAQNTFRQAFDLRQNRGRHNWTVGGELGRKQINGSEISSHRGVIQFRNDFGRDAITNFRLAEPARFSGASGEVHRGYRAWEPSLYAGDRVQMRPWLTLSFGLRYEPMIPPTEVNDYERVEYGCSCLNFAPRFGFAARLGKGWGQMRGNFGMHYGEVLPITYIQIRYNPPAGLKYEVPAPDLLAALALVGRAPSGLSPRNTPLDLDPGLKSPYSNQYNFSWEPAAFGKWRVQLGYTGSRTFRILTLYYHNRALRVPGIPLTTATVPDRRPDQTIHEGRRVINSSTAYYDAARASLFMPRWKGVTLEAAYWFSKAIDLGAAFDNSASSEDGRATQSQTEFDLHRDLKSRGRFDQPHALLLRSTWSAPSLAGHAPWMRSALGRWEVSGVVLAKNGTPFTVTTGSDGPGFGNVDGGQGDRPFLLDPAVLGRTIGHPDTSTQRLPRSAFRYIRPGEDAGNLGVNTFRRGRIANVNASLSRTWTLRGDKKAQFRAESLNLLNTPQFAEPSFELANPAFGFITNTLNDGRAMRFTLRLMM